MLGLLIRLVVNAVGLWVTSYVVNLFIPGGMQLTANVPGLLLVALVLGVVNALVRPIISLLSCPITMLTLGLFTLVINALMLILTSFLVGQVADQEWFAFGGPWNGFLAALLAGVIMGIVNGVLTSVFAEGR
jgi:putative membrane protein